MKLFLDTAEERALAELWPLGAFAGVTTNPLLLAKAGIGPQEAARRCRRLRVPALFLQAAIGDADAVVADAKRLASLWKRALWIKVPAVPEGFAAMARLRRARFRTAATAVLSLGQALLAAEAGADVVIPFLGRAESSGIDPVRLLEDVACAAHDAGARVLAASVKSEEHVRWAMRAGCWGATVPPDLARALARCEAAAPVVESFRAASRDAEE